MSDAAIPAGAGKLDPESLVLRSAPRPVTRFKRKVVVAALGGTAIAVFVAAWMALGRGGPHAGATRRPPARSCTILIANPRRTDCRRCRLAMTRYSRPRWARRYQGTWAAPNYGPGKAWVCRPLAPRLKMTPRAPRSCGRHR